MMMLLLMLELRPSISSINEFRFSYRYASPVTMTQYEDLRALSIACVV